MEAVAAFAELDPGMQAALRQAWASTSAGSLGMGAAATDADGSLLAVGRNRLLETDPGDDVLAGTSLAHAELNVLAKLAFRAHDSVVLHTTLQPCVQCLAAIRLGPVASVQVLAPDPLWRGVERIRHVTSIGRRWPAIEQRRVDEWSVFALLGPTRHGLDHPQLGEIWASALPMVADVARTADEEPMFRRAGSVVEAADLVWDELAHCVDEVVALTHDDGTPPPA